ncbi:MAG: hypothetical protein ACOYXT_16660 [Bacteroidota bacterium]
MRHKNQPVDEGDEGNEGDDGNERNERDAEGQWSDDKQQDEDQDLPGYKTFTDKELVKGLVIFFVFFVYFFIFLKILFLE